jgi:uncharacterized protein
MRAFAVITGASSGIGFQLAKQCVVNGLDVLVCAADLGITDAAVKLSHYPGSVSAVRADVATRDGVARLYQAICDAHRPVDALLLNAGAGVGGAFVEATLEDELAMIELCCMHVVHLAKLVVPEMVARGCGRVAITGAAVSTSPSPYDTVHAATEAFVLSFGEGLRAELAGSGVSVAVIQPTADGRRAFAAIMATTRSKLDGVVNELLPDTLTSKSKSQRTITKR